MWVSRDCLVHQPYSSTKHIPQHHTHAWVRLQSECWFLFSVKIQEEKKKREKYAPKQQTRLSFLFSWSCHRSLSYHTRWYLSCATWLSFVTPLDSSGWSIIQHEDRSVLHDTLWACETFRSWHWLQETNLLKIHDQGFKTGLQNNKSCSDLNMASQLQLTANLNPTWKQKTKKHLPQAQLSSLRLCYYSTCTVTQA